MADHEHPAPWEWEDGKLKDRDGALLLWPERIGPDMIIRRCCEKVRGVTERAGAMEALLRAARDRSGEHYAGPFWEECDALLEDIDKAKAGG